MEQTTYVVYLTSTPKTLAIDPACQSDPFYRYKMRQLTVQTIGNGKMIRTSFTNLDDVAKDLKVPPSYIPHYLGKAIGAQAKYDEKKPAMQRGSISGEHGIKELSNLLVRFIREFVLCGKCKLPELDYVPKKNDLEMRCHGCGWKGSVGAIGTMNEKFKKFVYTHPPPPRRDTKKARPTGAAGPLPEGNGKSKKKPQAGAGKAEGGEDDNVVWLSDTSEKAMEERMEVMVPDRLKALVAVEGEKEVAEPAAPAKPQPAEELKAFAAKTPAPSTSELIGEVSRLASANGLNPEGIATLIFDALLSDLATLKDKIKPYRDLLAKYLNTDALAQMTILEAIENKLTAEKDAKKRDEFINKKAVFTFKEFYDEDLIDEETILSWFVPEGETPAKKLDPLRKAVQPFCKWLEEAEEESDGEEEGSDAEESDEEPAATTTAPAKAPAIVEEKDAIDDEIDAL